MEMLRVAMLAIVLPQVLSDSGEHLERCGRSSHLGQCYCNWNHGYVARCDFAHGYGILVADLPRAITKMGPAIYGSEKAGSVPGIHVENTYIEEFMDPNFTKFVNLQRLILKNSPIKNLPRFSNIPPLHVIHLEKLDALTVPDEYFLVSTLRNFTIRNLPISSLSNFVNLPLLKKFELEQTKVAQIPRSFFWSSRYSMLEISLAHNWNLRELPAEMLQSYSRLHEANIEDKVKYMIYSFSYTGPYIPEEAQEAMLSHMMWLYSLNLNGTTLEYMPSGALGDANIYLLNGQVLPKDLWSPKSCHLIKEDGVKHICGLHFGLAVL